jgi:two-component system chemotaxis response regulator CheB
MRVLVVDDSTVFRKVVRDALAEQPGVEVVGVAPDGRKALEKIEQLSPDVVTLDVEMPELDGLGVLRELRQRAGGPSVIVLSSFTTTAAALTAQALRLGAFDFILKPSETSLERNVQRLREELEPKIRLLSAKLGESCNGASEQATSHTNGAACAVERPKFPTANARPKIIAIGVSTGGPAALHELLPKLPADFPTPIAIVQHMPPIFTRSLAEDLDRSCAISVREASDGETLRPGVAYIAPGGRQMQLDSVGGSPTIKITDDPPERSCRPSVDYMFRSVAHLFGPNALAVILTGMGDDGAAGCRLLKRYGAQVAAQDQASCVVYGMPRQVIEAGLADVICPLQDMHDVILRSVCKGVAV